MLEVSELMLIFVTDNLPYKAKDGNMSMNDKPHTPYDAAPMETPRASEPMVTYGHVATTESPRYHPTSYEMEVIMQSKKDFAEGRSYTQEEVDKMVEEWLR